MLNPLKPNSYFKYHRAEHYKILGSAHKEYLRVLYRSENKERLFPYKAL